MIIIVLIALLIVVLIMRHRLKKNKQYVVKLYKGGNVGANGKRRKGKDLLHQLVIWARNEPYYANIEYGYEMIEKIDLSDLQLKGIDYHKFIEGQYDKIDRRFMEKVDIYISDGGNFLPSQYHKDLEKKYPSMPIFISLQGHLYASNIHFNWNGEATRIWDKVREQMDEYIKVVGSVDVFVGRFIFIRHYSRPQAFEENKLPFKKNRLLDPSINKSMRQQYEAENGIIKNMWLYIPYKKVKYDTRVFEKMIFKEGSERIEYVKG